ncbi:MAG: phenylalanine--tRNA ligase subunit beta [Gemmatimonas sp.]
MKFTLNWLRDHLDSTADVAAISRALTDLGLEVESVTDRGKELAPFRVAHVIDAKRHPEADRLQVCMVDTGEGAPVQVVCGAPNARAGLKVVFAPPGTYVPGSDITLKKTKIRGVESAGMLCSARELELGEDHDGIIELPANAPVGAPAAGVLGVDDPVFDVAITPNRADCLGVHGIARDLAAGGLGHLKPLAPHGAKGSYVSPVNVTLALKGADDACPVFAGRYVRGVKNRPSPEWLQTRLKAIGLRPISALVDITNYLTFDRARPLHVFDADTLTGHLVVRLARPGEKLEALNGKSYELTGSETVIADDDGVLSLGGVVGGTSSGCTEGTVNVFVESALFDPVRTAETGRKHAIESDARYRFERAVDPASVLPGLDEATRLIVEICGGEPSQPVIAGHVPQGHRTVPFRPARVMALGGAPIAEDEVLSILERLGFTARPGTDRFEVTVPTWRADVHGEADVIEEVLRVKGYAAIPAVPLPMAPGLPPVVETVTQRRRRDAKRALAARGMMEAVTFSFMDEAAARLFGFSDERLRLANPISAELSVLRPSIVPNLAAAAARNAARGSADVALFEVGPIYGASPADPTGSQRLVAAGVRTGKTGPRHWGERPRDVDVFDAKADALGVLAALGVAPGNVQTVAEAPPWFHPGRSGSLRMGPQTTLAHFGELHPRVAKALDAPTPIVAFEINLDALPLPKKARRGAFQPSPFQAVERDFAFVVDEAVTADAIVRAAKNVDRTLIDDVSVFDVYAGGAMGEGKKSVAIAVRLQPRDATLTDVEIEALAAKIVAAVAKATGATLRS